MRQTQLHVVDYDKLRVSGETAYSRRLAGYFATRSIPPRPDK